MKNMIRLLLIFCFPLIISCNESNRQQETNENEEDLRIQGKETGGMGTGPGPGVDVPLDTAGEITPDTLIVE